MGIYPTPQKCFITDLPTTHLNNSGDYIDYFIDVNNKKIALKFDHEIENSIILKRNKHIFKGLILNEKWVANQSLYINDEELKNIIEISDYPRTPNEKLENLFLELFGLQSKDGEEIFIKDKLYDLFFYGKLYFKDFEECNYYLNVLEEKGLIETNKNYEEINIQYTITFKGLNYQIEITEKGENSKNCFIAMSFGEGMDEIRSAIKQAIIETGFIPIIVDEIHVKSDVTINDEILASIKKSRFCISDFTQQKNGVYFEAGYALGRGLNVIYTCTQEDFINNAHFDINHYLHILYDTPEELKKRLIDKIEAWIK